MVKLASIVLLLFFSVIYFNGSAQLINLPPYTQFYLFQTDPTTRTVTKTGQFKTNQSFFTFAITSAVIVLPDGAYYSVRIAPNITPVKDNLIGDPNFINSSDNNYEFLVKKEIIEYYQTHPAKDIARISVTQGFLTIPAKIHISDNFVERYSLNLNISYSMSVGGYSKSRINYYGGVLFLGGGNASLLKNKDTISTPTLTFGFGFKYSYKEKIDFFLGIGNDLPVRKDLLAWNGWLGVGLGYNIHSSEFTSKNEKQP